MNALDFLGYLYRLGVRLTIGSGQIRARAAEGVFTAELRTLLIEHKAAIIDLLGDGEFPDDALPSVRIPASVANDVESIRACIDAQRARRAA
jgi:hypothetical protein